MDESKETLEKVTEAVETAELAKVSEELTSMVTQEPSDTTTTSSRGEEEPKPFNKSIAEMEEKAAEPQITMKEIKALKRARYDKIAEKFQFAYVIKNKMTGLVVEIRAASTVHAAKIIGWRPRHVELFEVLDKNKEETPEETEKVEEGTEVGITTEVTTEVTEEEVAIKVG